MEGFEVEVDGAEEELDGDKTKSMFAFDSVLKVIKVTKVGFKEGEVKDYKVIDGENKVKVELEIKKVRL